MAGRVTAGSELLAWTPPGLTDPTIPGKSQTPSSAIRPLQEPPSGHLVYLASSYNLLPQATFQSFL